MSIVGYETVILAGTMLLLVWYVSLPYDNAMFNVWNDEANQHAREGQGLETSIGVTGPIVEKMAPYDIGYVIEEAAKISVYFAIPSAIVCKMLVVVRRELRLNAAY